MFQSQRRVRRLLQRPYGRVLIDPEVFREQAKACERESKRLRRYAQDSPAQRAFLLEQARKYAEEAKRFWKKHREAADSTQPKASTDG